jgi:hypothetical protein
VIVGYYLLTYGYGQEHFRHVESYLVLSGKAKVSVLVRLCNQWVIALGEATTIGDYLHSLQQRQVRIQLITAGSA